MRKEETTKKLRDETRRTSQGDTRRKSQVEIRRTSRDDTKRKTQDEKRRLSGDEPTKKTKKMKKKKNMGLSRKDIDFLQTNTRFNEKDIQDWYRYSSSYFCS